MFQLLKLGSRGPEVTKLQNALNTKLMPSPRLVPDGSFGMKTETAVRKLQTENWLVVDGQAGRCTQACAYGEPERPILHSVRLIPQPTPMTCWAASTAMMTNSTVPAVIARTPPEMVSPSGGLYNSSETDQALPEGEKFAAAHGLRCNPPMSYMLRLIRSKLERGPLMFDMLWKIDAYLTPNEGVPGEFMGSPGHVIVVFGIRGDGNEDGVGTTLRIHDPWSPNVGKTFSVSHARFMQKVPGATYRVFER